MSTHTCTASHASSVTQGCRGHTSHTRHRRTNPGRVDRRHIKSSSGSGIGSSSGIRPHRGSSLQLNARWSQDDDDPVGATPTPPCSLLVSIPLSNLFDRAVKRASDDPFVPYKNTTGIINLAECGGSNGGGMGEGDDVPDMTPEELVAATLGELRDLFGTGGIPAEAALTFGGAAVPAAALALDPTAVLSSSGFVWISLGVFMETPDWEGEADLWESMLETYNLLLAPGALRGAREPGMFLMCVAGRDEEVLLTGVDRLRTQLTQRKFLHGRW
uniref:Uncharacterized protein n=1 Tax=Mantoniella antarctica TaxID=81844 RepID=A0A7S0SN20_9CHLO|mmetsp:Transcript_28005/g.70391  ORF Transcript_28005/g.70391 Transcript_28005/m.70391 type:complete len:273 (+) Transcript_28005:228-1046(+)|eukprot:CAMPEP_0181362374 /NCGR_PEP_ID=MMETSP1106-20121128/7965_1 /TAXON_ID=81844 /ORGANISM="Mantoniella antarctica, Strain SL-175" /LENGTH=272 /DNA_ID=CAMNT_0023476309 /DNA_START=201 /DNA_END=1019 /DNA_ORIENTATION=+